MTPYHSPSLLVIDDEIELSKLYEEYFKMCGYDVISFTDPVLALDFYKQNVNRFSCILTDFRMPQMSGIELACKIRKINGTVRILLITAYTTEDIVNNSEFVDVQIEMVIQKPVEFKILRQYVENHITASPTLISPNKLNIR